jgi:hypothetical protein
VKVLSWDTDKVPVAALQSEAVRQRGKTNNDVHDRPVNGAQIQRREGILPILYVSGVFHELPGTGERLQWSLTFFSSFRLVLTLSAVTLFYTQRLTLAL